MVGFLRCCVVGLLSFSVLAVEAAPRQKPVVRPASTQDQFKKGQTTLDIDRHWGEVIDVPSSQYTSSAKVNVPVVQKSKYSPGRIAGAIKNVLKNNPIKVAATAAGVYLIHQLPGANFDAATGQPLITPGFQRTGTSWQMNTWGGTYFGAYPSFQAGCDAMKPNILYYETRVYDTSNGSNICRLRDNFNGQLKTFGIGYSVVLDCPNGFNTTTSLCNVAPIVPVPLDEPQLDQLASGVNGFTESHWNEIGPILLDEVPATFDGPDGTEFTGPASIQGSPTVTTSTDIGTGNTTVTESIPSFTFDYSTDPLSITTNTTVTNNTYENGVQTSTSTSVQTSPSTGVETVPEIEVPTDCDFMPTVCSFIDWVKDPFEEEEPDLSDLISDDDFQKNIDFSSNASCPAPSIMATSQGSFEFSWQPACQWAGMVKPFIIIAALLAAIFINLGAIRGPN